MNYKIIADSSCDLMSNYINEENITLDIAPLTINVNNEEFVDNENLDILNMMEKMEKFKGKSTSSCPSPNEYLQRLTGADKYFILTLSSKLSGSYNSACIAKNSFNESGNVFVINSKSTAGMMVLIIKKLVALIKQGLEYEEICEQITNYTNNDIGLLFCFDRYDNLVKNGRMSPLQALISNTLHLKVICQNENGEIKAYKKAIGQKRAHKELVSSIINTTKNKQNLKCIINHCETGEIAQQIKQQLENLGIFKSVEIIPMRGLCSFYAQRNSIIVSFEK